MPNISKIKHLTRGRTVESNCSYKKRNKYVFVKKWNLSFMNF